MVLKRPKISEVINALSFPVWCVDENYTLLYFNNSLKDCLSNIYQILVYRGINMVNFLNKEPYYSEYFYWKGVYNEIFNTGITKTIIHELPNMSLKINISPIFDNEKKVKYVVGIIENITDTKKIENDLKEKNKSLEQFAYITAHDLKTPLRSLSGLVNTLLKYIKTIPETKQVKIEKIVELIKDNSIKMNEIIDDTLSYSRATQDLVISEYNIRESVLTALNNLNYMVNRHDVKVNNLINGLVINADKGQLNQLFQNLISNAIKFNDKKNKIVTIGYLPNKEGFYVEDNGIGVDEKYIPKLFKMFQRLDHTKEGTGIGLAIVKKVVDNHNWKIKIESELNKKTIFKIYI